MCRQVTLLENKKSFQVNIFLRQFRIPTSEVMAHLARGDSEPLGAEKLRGLRNVLPETEEVRRRAPPSERFFPARPRIRAHRQTNELFHVHVHVRVTDTCRGDI